MSAHIEDAQTLCPHCEEVVHRYALYCPYCQKSLGFSQQDTEKASENKVMPLTTSIPLPEPAQEESIVPTKPAAPTLVKSVLALIFLLTSSFFFFFGILVRFFSENGVLVLQWSETSWPYYVFPSLGGIAVGYFLLYKVE